MAKYIDANALKAVVKELDSGGDYTVYHFLELIDAMPAADVEPVRKWIPCSERLPEDGKRVLVYWEWLDRKTNTVYGFIDILYQTSEHRWCCDGRGELNLAAIAWMSLPKLPKTDGGE